MVLAFGGSNDRISSFDKEGFIESVSLFVTSSLGVELTCRDGEDFISGFRKEVVNELMRPMFSSTFGTELAGRDDKDAISCCDGEGPLLVISTLGGELT